MTYNIRILLLVHNFCVMCDPLSVLSNFLNEVLRLSTCLSKILRRGVQFDWAAAMSNNF